LNGDSQTACLLDGEAGMKTSYSQIWAELSNIWLSTWDKL